MTQNNQNTNKKIGVPTHKNLNNTKISKNKK